MSQHNQQHNQHNIKEFNPYTFYFVNAIDNHDNIDAKAIKDVEKCYDANGNLDYTLDSCNIPNDNCYVGGKLKHDNEGCNIPNDCNNPDTK